MDIQFYETFLEVADTLSFRAASENLSVVQSTVSNRIQALEDYYGKTLFNRSNKKVALTSTGKVVLPYAKRIVNLHKEALSMADKSAQSQHVLKIAVDPAIYKGQFLDLVNSYTQKFVDTKLELSVLPSKNVLAGLSDGIFDVGFVYNKAKVNNIDFIPYVKDHFIFVLDQKEVQFLDHKQGVDSKEITLNKTDVLSMQLVKKDYGEKFDTWLKQIVPEDYNYALQLSNGANPIKHIHGTQKAGFILESDLLSFTNSSVQTARIKGLDMPYFQSYFIYKSGGDRKESVTQFMQVLNLQK